VITEYVRIWCWVNVGILPAYTVRTIAARFLSSQGISRPLLYIGVTVYCIWHPFFLYMIFVYAGKREFIYAPVANVVTAGLQTLLTLGYCVVIRPHHPLSLQPVSVRSVLQWTTNWKEVAYLRTQQDALIETLNTTQNGHDEDDHETEGNGNRQQAGAPNDTPGGDDANSDYQAIHNSDTVDLPSTSRDQIERDRNALIVDKGMSEYVELLFAGIFSLCAEWWSWEVVTIIVGLLGPTQLAVHVIYATIIPLYYMIPLGLGLASASRIGTLIGERRFDLARRLGNAILWFSLIEGTTLAVLSFFIRLQIPQLFTKEPEVIRIAAELSPLYCLFVIPDAMQGSFQGVLRGIKRQGRSSWGVLIGPWMTSIPLACILAFGANWEIFGMWTGNNTGYWMMDAVFLYVWASYKWEREPEHNLDSNDELEPIKKDYLCEDTGNIEDIMGFAKMSHFSAFAHFNKLKHD